MSTVANSPHPDTATLLAFGFTVRTITRITSRGVKNWPASVPDSMTYPEWNDGTINGESDWRSLGQIYPDK